MKSILVFCSIVFSIPAFAADVKITSFRYLDRAGNFSPTAELCGEVVTPTNKPEMVKVTIDPKSKSPGYYYPWAGPEGKFCVVVATFTGNAEAELQK